jgi:hypothetical protein
VNPTVATIRVLSSEAYELALRYAEQRGPVPAGVGELRDKITGLYDELTRLEGHDAQSARVAFSEALIDLDWIESEGRLATSVRMAMYFAAAGGTG